MRNKRHVGLASANMEKQALQNALHRLQTSLNVVEVATDASTSIKKLLGKNSHIAEQCIVQCVMQIVYGNTEMQNSTILHLSVANISLALCLVSSNHKKLMEYQTINQLTIVVSGDISGVKISTE